MTNCVHYNDTDRHYSIQYTHIVWWNLKSERNIGLYSLSFELWTFNVIGSLRGVIIIVGFVDSKMNGGDRNIGFDCNNDFSDTLYCERERTVSDSQHNDARGMSNYRRAG